MKLLSNIEFFDNNIHF